MLHWDVLDSAVNCIVIFYVMPCYVIMLCCIIMYYNILCCTTLPCTALIQVLVSGGDDCSMKLWDLRCPGTGTPLHSVSKFFTAGVTSAQWCPYPAQQHLYAVGSYDGSIALWDERMQRREPLVSVDSGEFVCMFVCMFAW